MKCLVTNMMSISTVIATTKEGGKNRPLDRQETQEPKTALEPQFEIVKVLN
jgi:hypothetical protein